MRKIAAVLVSVLLASSSFAGDWAATPKPPPGTPGQPPPTSEGGYSSPDRGRFGEEHRRGALDQICSHIDLKTSFRIGDGGFAGSGIEPRRSLERYENGEFAIIDDIKMTLGWSKGWAWNVGGSDNANVGIHLGARIEGLLEVVRPSGSKNSCAMLPRMLNMRDMKLPVDMTLDPSRLFPPERIAAMAVRELWNVPFTLTVSRGGSVGIPTPHLVIGYSKSITETGGAAVTVYRVSESVVRFRFRLDYVKVYTDATTLTAILTPGQIATEGASGIMKFLKEQANSEMGKWTSAWINHVKSESDGKRMVLEFEIDPRDPAQTATLSKALEGNLLEAVEMAKKLATLQANDDAVTEAYAKVRKGNKDSFGANSAKFVAVDDYHAKNVGKNWYVPIITQGGYLDSSCSNTVRVLEGGSGQFVFHCADDSSTSSFLTIPKVLGTVTRNSMQSRVEAVVRKAADEPVGSEPIMVYMRNHAVLRLPPASVNASMEELNAALRITGAQRGAAPGRLQIDQPVQNPPRKDGQEWSDRRGQMSLTLVFNEKAVREAAAASAEQLLKAYAAVTDPYDAGLLDWLTENAVVRLNNVEFDAEAAGRHFDEANTYQGVDAVGELRDYAKKASLLLADYADLVCTGGANQARALAKLMSSNESRTGLGVEKSVKIFLQLVQPEDVRGDWSSSIRGGGKTVNLSLQLTEGREKSPILDGARQVRERFQKGPRTRD